MTDDRKTLNEKISDAFDVDNDIEETLPAVKEDNLPCETDGDEVEEDFQESRKTLKALEEEGMEAIRHLMLVAKESETGAHFKALSELIKTTSEVAKDKLDIHEKKKNIISSEGEKSQGINVNKANILVAPTSEILKKIKDE